ncbi:hypothetical protein LFL96_00345 [Paraburkholderia sp. D15]|uniref:hypothetical protein n=1 Tax=Paraburkholderia sp. D15 TaxID=2880218 RepID=UPI00247B14D7|nr:hypothetical protein [Paraburkholderia sp. D15]WGS50000.1 hypothetical protein LFL96_00345 [Paraburkholderia sp. D15]
MADGVMYWTSDSSDPCTDFKPVGRVFYSGRDVLLPWIAKMNESIQRGVSRSEASRERYVKPGTPIQIKGYSGSPSDEGRPNPEFSSCGPIVTAFTPEKAKTYLVEFVFNGTESCSQHVSDITNASKPVAVGAYPLQCKQGKPGYGRPYGIENFLKAEHEQALEKARKEEAAATSPSDKAVAMNREAAELDPLGKPDEALVVIDRALPMLDTSKRASLIATKAGILFNRNDPQGALNLLKPELERTRKAANAQPVAQRAVALGTFTEGFITATFSYMQLEQWQNAINTLADAESPLEGADFYAYRSLVYRYIMTRANNASLANPMLEERALYYAANDKGYYGPLLRMYQGEDTIMEVVKITAKMTGSDQQDAFAETLFYSGAYLKFVKGNEAGSKAKLDGLNRLAPYGSIEWIYGKRVLN